MAIDNKSNADTLPSLTTDYFHSSPAYTTPLPCSAGESPSESSTMGAMRAANAYAYAESLTFEKETPPSSHDSGASSTHNKNHHTKEFQGKGKGKEVSGEEIGRGGAQNTEYERMQADKKKKEQEVTEAWGKRFDAAQPGGRSLSVLDPEWADLRERFQEEMERRAKVLRENPEAVPVEKKRKRDFVKRWLLKMN